MNKVYVIMFLSEIFESTYYTDEDKISKRVEHLNKAINSEKYWYKTLFEINA